MREQGKLVLAVLMCGLWVVSPGCSGGKEEGPAPTPPVTLEVLVPTGYVESTPAPLVVYLHGFTDPEYDFEDVTAFYKAWHRLQDAADAGTVLVAIPRGDIDSNGAIFWNGAGCCDVDGANPDHVSYLRGVVDDVSARYSVDPKRVYFMGHSNGAAMAHRMGCEAADLTAGVVAIAGSTWSDPARCTPSSPVPVLQVHGTADISYDGGVIWLWGTPFGRPSATLSISYWAAIDGCSPELTDTGTRLDLDSAVAGNETEVAAHACTQGAAELWTMRGSEHEPALIAPAATIALFDWLLAHPRP